MMTGLVILSLRFVSFQQFDFFIDMASELSYIEMPQKFGLTEIERKELGNCRPMCAY